MAGSLRDGVRRGWSGRSETHPAGTRPAILPGRARPGHDSGAAARVRRRSRPVGRGPPRAGAPADPGPPAHPPHQSARLARPERGSLPGPSRSDMLAASSAPRPHDPGCPMAALRHATIALCRTSLLWACLPCAAGEAPPARPPERQALAAPAASGAIRVDGVLDEPAWRDAPVARAFVLMSPREGQAPDESTTVRVLRDGDRIVFGIWCQAKRAPHASLVPRDQVLDGDNVSVNIDTDGDGQRAYIFGV